jgi:hypothetical protein
MHDDLIYAHFQRDFESLDVSISLELSRFLLYIEISNRLSDTHILASL